MSVCIRRKELVCEWSHRESNIMCDSKVRHVLSVPHYSWALNVWCLEVCTLRLRRPLFCCCCCSMSSMAEAGGEAALMALTTLMLSSGSGGRFRRSRPRTFISCSSSKPPKVNWKIKVGDRNSDSQRGCGQKRLVMTLMWCYNEYKHDCDTIAS